MCFGSSQPMMPAPVVVRENPAAEQARIEAAAASTAAQKTNARRQRVRANSLLAQGGAGDTSSPLTGQPMAVAGKATLGA